MATATWPVREVVRPAAAEAPSFPGYGEPTFIPIPSAFVRWQMVELSLAERAVMLYIFAQTYGYGQPHAPVSLRAMRYGRKVGGRQVDQGVGLDPPDLLEPALDTLIARQFLFPHPYSGPRGEQTTIYELNVDGRGHYEAGAHLMADTMDDTTSASLDLLTDPTISTPSALQERVAADTATIQQHLAEWDVSDSHARWLAALSAQRADPPTYITDLLAYVTSVPDVQNPLALLDHLCRQGLTRSAPKHPLPAGAPYRYGTHPTPAHMVRLRQGWIKCVKTNPGLIRHTVEARLRHPEDYVGEPTLEETFPELAELLATLQAELGSEPAADAQTEDAA